MRKNRPFNERKDDAIGASTLEKDDAKEFCQEMIPLRGGASDAATEVSHMQYVGIDLGVKSCSASIVDEQGDTKEYLEFGNDEEGWKTLVDSIDGDVEIAMEVGTCMYPIYDYLTSLDLRMKVGHPPGIKTITGSSSKTDRKDSEILANLLRLNYLPLSYVPTKEIMKATEILRTRIMIGRELNRVKNRIHAFLVKNGETDMLKKYTDPYGPGGRRELRKLRFDDYRDSILRAMLAQLEGLMEQKEIILFGFKTSSRPFQRVRPNRQEEQT